MRTRAIARELGLAVVTVDLHLKNARRKLGAATREQAVVLYRARTGIRLPFRGARLCTPFLERLF